MFALHTSDGSPIDKRWAERSARNTPAVEIIQIKGASETHPALSPNDEFAGFEDKFEHLFGSGGVQSLIDKSFVRQALIDGVGFQEMIGANPFKYGIVAGADSHIAASVNEEFNYTGVHGNIDTRRDSPESARDRWPAKPRSSSALPAHRRLGPGEYPRGHLRRHQAQGDLRHLGPADPRAVLRRLGLREDLVKDKDFVKKAYAGGVPMGGDLPQAKPAKAPTFAVWALKDPDSGNLDRVQIIKGWYDKRGYGFEKIYDVAWSDGRKPDPKRQAAAGRQHGRHQEGDLHQHHRRHPAERGLDGSGLRSVAARGLLRARARDSDAALVDLRRRRWASSLPRKCRPPSRNAPGHHPSGIPRIRAWSKKAGLLSRPSGEIAVIMAMGLCTATFGSGIISGLRGCWPASCREG